MSISKKKLKKKKVKDKDKVSLDNVSIEKVKKKIIIDKVSIEKVKERNFKNKKQILLSRRHHRKNHANNHEHDHEQIYEQNHSNNLANSHEHNHEHNHANKHENNHEHKHAHDHNFQFNQMSSKKIGIALIINLSFTIIELIGSFYTHSSAIFANVIHDFGDCIGIGIALVFSLLSNKKASVNFTYGYLRISLLSAFINGFVLLFGAMLVIWTTIPKLFSPPPLKLEGIFILSLLGILFNFIAAKFLSHNKQNLNEKILSWHFIEDFLTWVVVLIVSVIMLFSNLIILDPILTLFVSIFIFFNVFKNFNKTVKIFLQAVPDKNLHFEVEKQLSTLPYIKEFHHLHLWSLDGVNHVLTVHLVLEINVNSEIQNQIKEEISKRLNPYNFAHTTIEFEQKLEICRDNKAV